MTNIITTKEDNFIMQTKTNREKRIKAIIFDLDDTLYSEKMFVVSGFQAVSKYISKKYNIPYETIFIKLKKDFERGVRKNNFNVLLEELGIKDDSLLNKLIDIYRYHFPDISLDAGMEKVIKELSVNFKLALITDGHPLTQKNKIAALKLSNYFDLIKINDISKGESKQDLEIFRDIIKQIGEKNNNMIFVGDNPLKDFIVPKKLGLYTVRIVKKDGIYSHIKKNLEFIDYTIEDIRELFKVIEDIEKVKADNGGVYERKHI